MDPRITQITLGVADVEDSIRFYRDGLGFPMQSRDADSDIAFFSLIGTRLSVYPREKLANDASVSEEGTGFSGISLTHTVPDEPEVDSILDEAAQVGGHIVKPAQHAPWGGYSGYFADPDGYLWEVVCTETVEA